MEAFDREGALDGPAISGVVAAAFAWAHFGGDVGDWGFDDADLAAEDGFHDVGPALGDAVLELLDGAHDG